MMLALVHHLTDADRCAKYNYTFCLCGYVWVYRDPAATWRI